MKQATVPQCSNCCRHYTVTGEGRQQVLRVPLLLGCGHSFCSVCVNQLGRVQRGTGVITCPQCAKTTSFLAGEEAARQLPCNIFILGLITANKLNLGGKIPTNGVVSRSLIMKDNPADIYIDLPSPLADEFSIECEECQRVPAEVKCTTCRNYLCDNCFELGHAALIVLRRHVKIPITLAMSSPVHCPMHKGHITQFYCRKDFSHLCSECVTMDTHKEHPVVSIQEEADYCRQQLKPMVVTSRSVLRRMKKSDMALSEYIPKLRSHVDQLTLRVHEDFCSLHCSLQLREQRLLEEVVGEADSYVQPILRMRKMLQDNIAMATKTINSVQRLLGDSIALVKSKELVNTKLSKVLQMESYLHCDDVQPISYWMDQSACNGMMSFGQIDCLKQYSVLLSATPAGDAVDEETVTSSDSQSHDSETPISSSVAHSPQKVSPKGKVGVAPPPGLPTPATNQKQLQRHVKKLLQEVSSSGDHMSSSDNDEHRSNTATPRQQTAEHPIDKQSMSFKQQQEVAPSEATANNEDSVDTLLQAGEESDEDIASTHLITSNNDSAGAAMVTASTEDGNDVTANDTTLRHDQQLVKVIVSHIDDPGHFYVQYSSDHHNLTTLMTELAEYCNGSPAALKFSSAKPGVMCAAQYHEDDLWYRAEVLELFPPSRVKVKYTDFGNKEWLNCKRLCVLPPEMVTQSSYCHRCCLGNIYPVDGNEWNTSLISRLKGITMDTELQMKITSSDDCGDIVDLRLPSNGPWLVSRLLETGMCSATAVTTAQLLSLTIPPHPQPDVGAQLECFVSFVHTPNEFYVQLVMQCVQLDKFMEELQEFAVGSDPLATDMLPGTPCLSQFSLDQVWYRAVVTGIQDGNCIVKYVDYGNSEIVSVETLKQLTKKHCMLPEQAFCCTLISANPTADGWSEETVQQFVDVVTNATVLLTVIDIQNGLVAVETVHGTPINEFLSQSGIYQMKNPVPIATDIPAAAVPEVGMSCNALVTNVQSPSNFHVQLMQSQYELQSALESVNKRQMRAKKIEVGHCYLAVDSTNMSFYRVCVVAAMATLAEQYEVYFIDNGSYGPVESHSLMEMSPALTKIPSLALCCSLDLVMPLDKEWSEQCLEFLSRLLLGNTVTITIKEKPASQDEPVLVDMAVALPGSGPQDVLQLLVSNCFAQVATPSVLAYKPASPPSDGMVTVIHINEEGVVCCQANESAETLCSLMDLLQTVAKKGKHPPKLVPGQPCAAIFSVDNLWYRARVISMTTTTAYVNFVDYGNNEDVLLQNIYTIKSQDGDIIDKPIHCLNVQLQGLESCDWSEELLAYMDSLILDRSCQLHVKEVNAEGIVKGTISTGDYPNVAEKMMQYINSTPPALLDSSDTPSNSVQNHVTSSPLIQSLPHNFLDHMTSSPYLPDHVAASSAHFSDHMIPKLPIPSLPNPTTINDSHDDEVD